MLSRFYLEDHLSFKEANVEFKNGLNVFTGPSGAGKSIFMGALLGTFGIGSSDARISEVTIQEHDISDELFDIELDDDIVIKQIKKEKTRYFINNQTVSKKALGNFSQKLVKHLHLKDTTDFKSSKLIALLDLIANENDKSFKGLKKNYQDSFKALNSINEKLQKINEDESRIEELKEFAQYEIEKISAIDPKPGEYEELNEIKKKLSKKDKIEESLNEANQIFDVSHKVSAALDTLEIDSSFFDDCMNELSSIFESSKDLLYELEDIDIEETLDRIEKISSLKKRFGSIEKALEYKIQKEEELSSYENISFEKNELLKEQDKLQKDVRAFAREITNIRNGQMSIVSKKINHYLKFLYLSNASLKLKEKELDITGSDEVVFELSGVNLDKISSGEFNRLRLALLTVESEYKLNQKGILFLDEIDANLSGKESESIAKVLSQLSKTYQIFAISHQPQLTSIADAHFLILKIDGESIVKKLDHNEKIDEVSRMISGESITKEAKEFAANLFRR